MKLNWVTLRVSDLDASIAFYTEMLGMEIASRFGAPGHEIVMLGKENDAKVELICEGGANITEPGQGVSFGLESDNLDELVAKLRDAGHAVDGPIAPAPGVRFFFVKDPDGYNVQLL